MSYFGDETLSQDILDQVENQKSIHNADTRQIISALAEIIQYFAEYRD